MVPVAYTNQKLGLLPHLLFTLNEAKPAVTWATIMWVPRLSSRRSTFRGRWGWVPILAVGTVVLVSCLSLPPACNHNLPTLYKLPLSLLPPGFTKLSSKEGVVPRGHISRLEMGT